MPLSTISLLSLLLSVLHVHSLDTTIVTLTTFPRKGQISLSDENQQYTWVYLTGREFSQDLKAYEIFDNVVSSRYKDVQTKSQSNSVVTIDCDIDTILRHSWLLTLWALMHFTINLTLNHNSVQHPVKDLKVIMRLIQLPLSAHSNDTAAEQIALLLDNTDIESIDVWDGFLNSFTGLLGKYGGGMTLGYQAKFRLVAYISTDTHNWSPDRRASTQLQDTESGAYRECSRHGGTT